MTAGHRFLSWARRGAATRIAEPDGAAVAPRVEVPVAITFNDDPALTASVTLPLRGPGDVVQLDPRAIVRVWPPPGTADAEANFFPLVEFDQVDLPWRYTPRTADATGRVRPWLCVIALRDGEIDRIVPPSGDRLVESVWIEADTPMPLVAQAWAWAHVQVTGDDTTPLATLVASEPQRCLARLLCPRRLDPSTTYTAMLVPTFEVGRLGGLREQPTTPPSGLAPAWIGGTLAAALELPVYHRWRFTTGPAGDFESLVSRLRPRPLPPSAGTRPLDVAAPGAGLPAAATTPLPLGGALRPPGPPPSPPVDETFVFAMAALLDRPAAVRAQGGEPLVAPPLYAAWHARRERTDPQFLPLWFHELNLDPRARVPAALGAEVVQAEQHALIASAWAQLAAVREANQQLRGAQLARAIGERLHRRFVWAGPTGDLLALAAPLLGHVRLPSRTARSFADASPGRCSLVSGAFRRAARPLGPIGRRQGRPDSIVAPTIERVAEGLYDAVLYGVAPLSPAVPSASWLGDLVDPDWPPDAAKIAGAPPCHNHTAWDPVHGAAIHDPPRDPGEETPSMQAFRAAALAIATRDAAPAPGEELHHLDLGAIGTAIRGALDPAAAIAAAFDARLVRAPGFVWDPPDPIEPVMAHPVFTQPMFRALAAISTEWILPGLGDLPGDTVTLAETNPAFIEAYLAGCNHELARELLWNEYPTDQRGTYFRQFWDPAGLTALPVPDTALDLTPMHTWSPTSTLGAHSPRPGGSTHLVLVVRGELLRRYPGTLVHAQRADRSGTTVALGTTRLDPAFAGRLAPDVAFFGFAIAEATVRGSGTAADPGWFFVFAEQPAEPRFGLDVDDEPPAVIASWDALAWRHLAPTPEAVAEIDYIELDATRPPVSPALDASGPWWPASNTPAPTRIARGADHAAITIQRPVRVAILAAQLLPASTP